MNPTERRTSLLLATIFSFRMLGLFMILPVFAIYAKNLGHFSPFLVGVAIGIYGLTQALFQLPLGMLSDRFGRKSIITIGLIIFALGSFIAAFSTSIYGVILGRAIQGAGAVGSVITALLADLTRVEVRTKAMAMIGSIIGVSFMIAMILGPILNNYISVSGIFSLTGILAFVGIFILLSGVPNPPENILQPFTEKFHIALKKVVSDKELIRYDLGIMFLHLLLSATFVVIPIALTHYANFSAEKQWYFYLPILMLAFISMIPMIIISEKRQKTKSFFLFAILLLVLSQIGLYFMHLYLYADAFFLYLFFTGFTFLEASLPSLISKYADKSLKGTALGVYSSMQFFGIFLGGILGGYIYQHFAMADVFLFCSILTLIWYFIALPMQTPKMITTESQNTGNISVG